MYSFIEEGLNLIRYFVQEELVDELLKELCIFRKVKEFMIDVSECNELMLNSNIYLEFVENMLV